MSRTTISMSFEVSVDGDDYHITNSTRCGDATWAEVYRGMLAIREEIDRQIAARRECPFNPKTIKNEGAPTFTD